ncbi:MAG: carboxypeptidase regulatory-like domain-containing protein, partial [Proteobacteria bacterium]|nr:carboxypeptidase regulatory-like domain-containing protein [Pseudomonadota bacterium]
TKTEDIFPIRCNIQPWMGAYCAVVDNPYHDVTENDGVYRIEGLPAGQYTVEAWHERLGTLSAEVSIEAHGETTADFTFKR